ncbi:MAG: hypothetical protein HYV08_15505 [Deltaproteobacteria bacterium]|nr:hypothetical protein [Deltaproteobacteria bacterium]
MPPGADDRLIDELGLRRERPFSLYDHPNLIRGASVVVFLTVWEVYGRRVDPVLFAAPTAIARAAAELVLSGELLRQTPWPWGGTGSRSTSSTRT